MARTGTLSGNSTEKDGGDFGALPNGSTFDWEHYVRADVSDGSITLSIFNNHNNADYVKDPGQTTGLLLELSLPPSKLDTPKVFRNLSVAGEPLYVGSQGSYTPLLSNGNAFMGYGQDPALREYGALVDGNNQKLLAERRFGLNSYVQSYGGFKFPWHATPAGWNPALVVKSSTNKSVNAAYVSWNGATDITSWYVMAGSNKTDLHFIGRAKKYGSETTFNVTSTLKCVQVIAVAGESQVRKSNVSCL